VTIIPIQVKAIAATTSLPGVPCGWEVTIRVRSGPGSVHTMGSIQ